MTDKLEIPDLEYPVGGATQNSEPEVEYLHMPIVGPSLSCGHSGKQIGLSAGVLLVGLKASPVIHPYSSIEHRAFVSLHENYQMKLYAGGGQLLCSGQLYDYLYPTRFVLKKHKPSRLRKHRGKA